MRYCPACRAEYAPGTEQCHDCEVELVDLLVDDSHDPERPPETLVTIAAYDTPVTASILASRLEAEGIESFFADEQAIAIHAGLTGMVGGVKVQVRESEAARAANVARQLVPAARTCPRCGSTQVTRRGLSFLLAALAVLTLGVLALFFPPRWFCDACQHQWH
jgi:hypothetical protein